MENEQKDNLRDLLGNITDFKIELDSGDEEMENPEGKSVEKYFNIKMINLLAPKNSYTNVKFSLSGFLEELKLYMFGKTFQNDNFDKKVGRKILTEMNKYFEDETEIEIDAFYTDVDGEKLSNFFAMIKNYSFPNLLEMNKKTKYTIIVESTYCLRKNIIKKSNQMRKNFLFFSILNKFYKQYKECLEDFYEFFIKKHIL